MLTDSYIGIVLHDFKRTKKLADRAIEQLAPEAFFQAPGVEDNSVAIIVKHLAGNLRSRWTDFLTSDGEKPNRDRDAEFIINPLDSRDALLHSWEQGWTILFDQLSALKPDDLARHVTIRGEPLTVLHAINRSLAHCAYHVGQIVYLAKHLRGAEWKTLSVPRGRSAEFNQNPAPYVEKS